MSKVRRAWLYEQIIQSPNLAINVLNLEFANNYTNKFFSEATALKAEKDLGRQLSIMHQQGLLHRCIRGLEYQNGLPKWCYEYTLR